MTTVTNPFQEILDKVAEVRDSQLRMEQQLAAISNEPKEELPINIVEASKITGLAKATIYSKMSRREIPGYRRGNRLFFYRSELLQWIRTGKRKTKDEIRTSAIKSLEER